MVALDKFLRESFLEGATFEHLSGKQPALPRSAESFAGRGDNKCKGTAGS